MQADGETEVARAAGPTRPPRRGVERLAEINAELIRTAAELSTVATAADAIGHPELAQTVRERLEHLASGAFVLAIVGEFKRGKSTLANALLGAEIMPSDVLPTTAAVNRVVYGRTPQASLRFRDGNEQTVPIERLHEFVTKLDDESATRAAALEEAVVAFPTQLCRQNVELLDTPGLGDEAAMTERTTEAIARVDAAVVVTSALAPFAQSEADILRELTEHVDPSRLFFVVGQIDLVPPDDVGRLVALVERRVRAALPASIAPLRVFPLSAREALHAKLGRDHARLAASRFEALEQALERFLVRDRGVAVVQVANEALAAMGALLARAAREQLTAIEHAQDAVDRELAAREQALAALGAEAAAFAQAFGTRRDEHTRPGEAAIAALAPQLIQMATTAIGELDLNEGVTDSAQRHLLVERHVGPRMQLVLSAAVELIFRALNAWVERELAGLTALSAQLDVMLDADRVLAGVGARSAPAALEPAEAEGSGGLLGDCAAGVLRLPGEFKLSYVPTSLGGAVRSALGNVAGLEAVKSTWLKFQGSGGQQLLKQRTENMANTMRQDYALHFDQVVPAELARLAPAERHAMACKALAEKLALKTQGETELVRKVCEVRPWELRVARQRARAEREREIERVHSALGVAERAQASAASRLAVLTEFLSEAPASAKES
jgi:hypothetical protein